MIPTHPVEFRCDVMWLRLGYKTHDTGKQKCAEQAEVPLCSLDVTRLVFLMPAAVSIWLLGDGNAALQTEKKMRVLMVVTAASLG